LAAGASDLTGGRWDDRFVVTAIASLANRPVQLTARRASRTRKSGELILVALATADDLATGMARAVALLRRALGAERVEWWAPSRDDDAPRLQVADGAGGGSPARFELGPAGFIVCFGGAERRARTTVKRIAPVVRRRFAEERLACEAARLVQRNQALEDFAALVAHELKTPLRAALSAPGGTRFVEQALELVDSVLEAARTGMDAGTANSAMSLAAALGQLGEVNARIDTELPPELPLAPAALHILLRNLIGNAVAAGAHRIHVAGSRSARSWMLVVDDDGVGLAGSEGYASGSGIGLQLCRRLAERLGGALELCPRLGGGTRATIFVGPAGA
jgi:signal transduction histidine kinase